MVNNFGRSIFHVAAGITCVAIVLVLTLMPTGMAPVQLDFRCLPCGAHGTADFAANILLFIPLGIVVGATRGIGAAALLGVALSIGVEATQWVAAIPGRHVTLADVIANTVGILAGAFIGRHTRVLFFPTRQQAAVLFVIHTAVVALLFFSGKYLLSREVSPEPFAPEESTLPHTTGYGWFERDVVNGAVDGAVFRHMKGGALRVVAPQRDSHALIVQVRGRDRRDGFVPVLFVHDKGDSIAHLMIGQRGDSYALRIAVRANKWGLHVPDLMVGDPFQTADTLGTPGMERRIEAMISGGAWSLAVHSESGVNHARYKIHPLHAWLVITPIDHVNSWLLSAGSFVYAMVLAIPMLYLGWRWAAGKQIGSH